MSKKNAEQTGWDIVTAILSNSPRTLLYGPPGTGKTHAACRLGLSNGQRMFSTDICLHTGADRQNVRVRIDGVDDLSRIEAQAVEVEGTAEEAIDDKAVARTVHMEVNVIGTDGDLHRG